MGKKKSLLSYSDTVTAKYLIHLMACALNGKKPEEKPDAVSFKELFELAAQNSVEGLSAYGIDALDEKPEGELSEKWMRALDLAVYHQFGFEIEREALFAKLSEVGISYMTLKGLRFAELYPMPGMRSMSDLDILFGYVAEKENGKYGFAGNDEAERAELSDKAMNTADAVVKEMGYSLNHGDESEVSYLKKPYYHVELHRKLTNKENHWGYYDDPFSMAKRFDTDPYRFEFTPEDEYVYYLEHTYKHFVGGGCGVRCLADIYVFLERYGKTMDRGYVDGELEKLGITEVSHSLEKLAYAALSENGLLTDEDTDLLCRLLYSGTYGNSFIRIDNNIEKKINESGKSPARARTEYILRRIFPSFAEIKNDAPIVYKFKMLYPFYILYRLIVKPFQNFGYIKRELKIIFRKKK